jgi:Tfp pilus assembly protein PilN
MLTINLLPNQDHSISAGKVLAGLAEIALMAVAIGLILASIWLQTAVSGVSTQVATKQAEKKSFKSSLDKATELQQKLQNIIDRQEAWQSSQKESRHFGQLIHQIAVAKPAKLRLSTLTNSKGDDLAMTGVAATRTDVTTFIDGLNKIDGLSGVTLGQANNQAEGVSFTISANLTAAATASPSPSPVKSSK